MYRCNQGLICTMSAIILPEQSVASEKAGLAVNKKGLTLKELLQQTSHHNAKIRKGIPPFMGPSLEGLCTSILIIYYFLRVNRCFGGH